MNGSDTADQPDFRKLFESIPGLYLVVKADSPRYTIVAVSDAYTRATLTKREEILGRGLFEVCPDNPSEPATHAVRNQAASLEEVIRTRTSDTRAIQRHDVRRPPESGGGFEERWWSPTNSPVFDASGALTHILHEVADVTEFVRLKSAGAERTQQTEALRARADEMEAEILERGQELERANRELRRLNEELTSFIELAPDAIVLMDLAGRLTSVNSAACRMFGYSRAELIGKLVTELISETDEKKLWRSRERLLDGSVEMGQWTGVRKGGSTFPAEVSAKILPGGRWQAFVRDNSDRSELERELQASNAELHRAQSVAKIGSWRLDPQTRELRWTEENQRIFGLPPGTPLTYQRFLACVHPDDRAYVDRAWTAALRGAPYDIEHRLLVAGEVKWVRAKADLTFDDTGRLLGGVGITQDMTERKRLEQELRLAEAKSSGILSLSADAIISIDEDQNITLFNEGAEKIFGYSKAEVIGQPLEMLIPERLRAIHYEKVKAWGRSPEVSRRMDERQSAVIGLRKNGEEFPADAALSKLEIGGMRIMTVALRDITERRRVEREQRLLAELGAAFTSTLDYDEAVANVARLAVRELADHCIVDLANDGAGRRFEVVSRDPRDTRFRDLLGTSPVAPLRQNLTPQVLATRAPILIEHLTADAIASLSRDEELRRALRELEPRSLIGVPLIARGELLGAMMFISTEPSRRYQKQDLPLFEELGRRAALAIDNARLYSAAQHAVRARDEVLGIVAHDLRNPLGAIRLNATLIGRRKCSQCQGSAAAIERAANRMNRLIEDLLDVARIEAGSLAVEPRATPVRPVVAEALASQRAQAMAAGIRLESSLAEDPVAWADRERLLQVLENLLGNAMKFTPRGGTVSLAARARDNDIVFSVADTGPGIPPDQLPRVFDRFWQVHRAGRAGAGLGLAIVKGIVSEHGGRVWAESDPGRGTTFYFTIPSAERRSAAPRPSGTARPSAPAEDRAP